MKRSFLAILALLSMSMLAGAAFADDAELTMQMPYDIVLMHQDGTAINGVRCATVDDAPADIPRAPKDLEIWIKEHYGELEKVSVNIPVAFHVLYYTHPRRGTYGEVDDQQLYDQIDVLNAAYAGTGVSFSLLSIDRTENKKWCTMRPGSGDEVDCKSTLAVDPSHTLNVYTGDLGGGLLGWSYFPWYYDESHYMHGSVIHYNSLPGGAFSAYNEGDTATHEIGHYLGLYHTFQGGCTEPNDYCDDTPQEASPDYYCTEGRDSCPDDPGLDPIHNYMDYTPDYCMYEFTSDQAIRIDWALTTYKPILIGAAKTQPQVASWGEATFELKGATPNPFNPRTEIEFSLRHATRVILKVYNLQGRLVDTLMDETVAAGDHAVPFDGRGMASGVYMVTMDANGARDSQRIVLIK